MINSTSQSTIMTVRKFSVGLPAFHTLPFLQQDKNSSSLSSGEYVEKAQAGRSIIDTQMIDTTEDASVIELDDLESKNLADNELDTRPPDVARTDEMIVAAREWDGTVVSIGQKRFYGEMSPVGRSPGSKTESLSYPLSMLSSSDRRKITEGSIFRVTVGRTRKRTGQITPHFSIYFRPISVVQSIRSTTFASDIEEILSKARIVSEG
jgi:hypothetical protein